MFTLEENGGGGVGLNPVESGFKTSMCKIWL